MPEWTKQTVEDVLNEKGWSPLERNIEHGIQFELTDGTLVNCYHSGTVNVQGRDSEIKREADQLFRQQRRGKSRRRSRPSSVASPSRVFIVYGHDLQARNDIERLLLKWKLVPVILEQIPAAGDTIIEKLEQLTGADYACVLLTPDDEGKTRRGQEDLQPRARQNVVLELGMVLARLGRRRVAVLVKGSDLERPSDIDGLLYLPFNEQVDEVAKDLAANLFDAGFVIQPQDVFA